MADFILIPFLFFVFFKIKYNKNGINRDYLSIENSRSLKGFFAIEVVLLHLTLEFLHVDLKLIKILQVLDPVKVFFFLSGFGLATQYRKKGDTYLKGFLSGHMIKIIVPFLTAIIPYYFLYRFTGSYYTSPSLTPKTLFTEFFNNGYTVVYNSWYVIEIAVLYLVFYISFKLSKKNLDRAAGLCTVLTTVVMVGLWLFCYFKNWIYVWCYSTYAFAFGIVWAAYEEKIFALIKKNYYKITGALIMSACIIYIILKIAFLPLGDGVYDITKNFTFAALILILVVVASMKIKLNPKFWGILGKFSFEIYLLHGAVYSVLSYYIKNSFLFALCVVVGSILVSIPYHWINNAIISLFLKPAKTKEV